MSVVLISSQNAHAVDWTIPSGVAAAERSRAANYPLSRWYLRPLAGVCARRLSVTWVTPCHVTCCGLLLAAMAAAVLILWPQQPWLAAALMLGYWFCDRTDGQLARLRGNATAFGGWLDANVDELADLGLHAALAYAAAQSGSSWAWPCLIGFVAGKYLLMYGMFVEPALRNCQQALHEENLMRSVRTTFGRSLVRKLYHLPANADVRLHLLVVAIVSGQYVLELAFVASYYNLRWLARYALVAWRLGGAA